MNTIFFSWKNCCYSLVLLIALVTLPSFSSVPVADVRDDNPPVEKTAESRRQTRLNKRYNQLNERFDKATNAKQRLRLQKKIRNVERQQDSPGTPVWGIIGLVLGIISFVLLIAGIAALIRAGITGTSALAGAGSILVGGIIAAITGLIISIVSLVLHSKDPERYTLKGFGIAGIIVSSIMFFFLLIITAYLFIFSNI